MGDCRFRLRTHMCDQAADMSPSCRSLAVAFVLQILAATPAAAQMWCEGRLVQIGATEQQVLDLCGEPDRREELNNGDPLIYYGSVYRQEASDEWTYNLGPGEFVRHLIFQGGILQQIRQGGYGSDP